MQRAKIGVLIFLLIVIPLTAALVLNNQDLRSKASVSGGTATMTLSPASTNLDINQTKTEQISFNTNGAAISIVVASVSYNFSGSTPEVEASNLVISPDILNGDGWSCPIHQIAESGGKVKIDISCLNTNTTGFTSTTSALLASFDIKANRVLTTSPLVLSFGSESEMRTKSTNTDILQTPTGANVTVTGSDNQSTRSHKVCINSACKEVAGIGSDQCSTLGATCTQTFSQEAANNCAGKYDPNCFNCVNDTEINGLDFACFVQSFGQERTGTINWH